MVVYFSISCQFWADFLRHIHGDWHNKTGKKFDMFDASRFLVAQYFAVENWGNHGLWFAFTLFYLGRFVFLYPSLSLVKKSVSLNNQSLRRKNGLCRKDLKRFKCISYAGLKAIFWKRFNAQGPVYENVLNVLFSVFH